MLTGQSLLSLPRALPLSAAVDANAGTFAAFYYKNIREFDTPTKDHMVAFGQDEKFTVGAFDVGFQREPRVFVCAPRTWFTRACPRATATPAARSRVSVVRGY